jgi:hemerythrin superfamily protein
MNAIDFLIKEHEKVRHTLAEIDNDCHREATKMKMFDSLCQDLIRHEEMEHKIWYPHFKNDKRLSETVKHLLSEEKGAEKAIKKFENITSLQAWEEKFSKFKEDVEHHASEEEHDLFPQVKNLLDEAELEKIGLEMYRFKHNYRSSLH